MKFGEVNEDHNVRGHGATLSVYGDYKVEPVEGCPVLSIDEQFRDLLPKSTVESDKDLETSIIESNGTIDSIKVWIDPKFPRQMWIVDGHRRYDVCRRLGLKYDVEVLPFESKESALLWIEEIQVSRRNLSPIDLSQTRMRMLNRRIRLGRSLGQAVQDVVKRTGVSRAKLKSDARLHRAMRQIHPEVLKHISGDRGLPIADYRYLGMMDHQTQLDLVNKYGPNRRALSRNIRQTYARELKRAEAVREKEMDERRGQPGRELEVSPKDIKRANQGIEAVARAIERINMVSCMSVSEKKALTDPLRKVETELHGWMVDVNRARTSD